MNSYWHKWNNDHICLAGRLSIACVVPLLFVFIGLLAALFNEAAGIRYTPSTVEFWGAIVISAWAIIYGFSPKIAEWLFYVITGFLVIGLPYGLVLSMIVETVKGKFSADATEIVAGFGVVGFLAVFVLVTIIQTVNGYKAQRALHDLREKS